MDGVSTSWMPSPMLQDSLKSCCCLLGGLFMGFLFFVWWGFFGFLGFFFFEGWERSSDQSYYLAKTGMLIVIPLITHSHLTCKNAALELSYYSKPQESYHCGKAGYEKVNSNDLFPNNNSTTKF